jgi:hypothetical protein
MGSRKHSRIVAFVAAGLVLLCSVLFLPLYTCRYCDTRLTTYPAEGVNLQRFDLHHKLDCPMEDPAKTCVHSHGFQH